MSAYWQYIIPGVFAAIVAIIEAVAARDRKTLKDGRERDERRAADRAEESRLSMRMMDAMLELEIATALAVEGGKLNGEMTAAKRKANEAADTYHEFVEKIAARQIAKK